MTSSGPSSRADSPGPVDDAHDMLVLGPGPGPRRPVRDSRPAPILVEASLAAVVVLLLWPVTGRAQRLALVRDLDVFGCVVLGSAIAAGLLAGWLHTRLSGGRHGRTGVGAVAAVVAATACSGSTLSAVAGWVPLAVVGAVSVATAVAAVRLPQPRRVAPAVVSVAGMVLLGVAAGQTVVQARPDSPAPVAPTAEDAPEGAPTPPPTDPPGPTLGDLCHPDELTLDSSVPVPAMSDAVATLTVTNSGGRSCRVEGFPTVTIIGQVEQADLGLQVRVSQVDPAGGDPVEVDPVQLAPGDAATTQVWWPTWGAAADRESPQQLRIGVGGSTEVLDLPPERRWDVVQSAEAWVGPWRPAEGA
ncbi:DUF4232 domain-containing protein [Serinicoccus chungangensis]|uniref:DUF4232 domain-containing protein n=1 Tax=Serinicoccus chungangensis TaxID=767452 RepID=UPI00111BB3E2|nr:DUF4232 domain-containing protein [Serinicoccus chungangensis]